MEMHVTNLELFSQMKGHSLSDCYSFKFIIHNLFRFVFGATIVINWTRAHEEPTCATVDVCQLHKLQEEVNISEA